MGRTPALSCMLFPCSYLLISNIDHAKRRSTCEPGVLKGTVGGLEKQSSSSTAIPSAGDCDGGISRVVGEDQAPSPPSPGSR